MKKSRTLKNMFLCVFFTVIIFSFIPSPFKARELPDLTVGRIKVETVSHTPGKCWVKVEIKNIGGPIPPSEQYEGVVEIIAREEEYGMKLGRYAIYSPLNQAKSSEWYRFGEPPIGVWHLLVKVDPYRRVHESNENNNVKSFTVVCNSLPDLAVTKIYTKPGLNGKCEIWAEIKNLSNFECPEEVLRNSSIRFYAGDYYNNGYPLRYLYNFKALKSPGGTLQINAPGNIYVTHKTVVKVKIKVDPINGIVWDANPKNNERAATLICLNPAIRKSIRNEKIQSIKDPRLKNAEKFPNNPIKTHTNSSLPFRP